MSKKFLSLMLALLAIATTARAQVTINTTNFPDEKFRNYVKDNYDLDENGSLNAAEIAAVTKMDVNLKSIANLTGIKRFTSLKTLHCRDNQLTSLDVSGLTKLEELSCGYNYQLATLNVSGCTNLTSLWCTDGQLTKLDVSGNTKLKLLHCYDNQLTSLNVSGLTNLETLSCYDNQLTSLNVSGLTKLQTLACEGNQLTSLNVSGYTNLTTLSCQKNSLTSLNVSGCTALKVLSCYNNKLTALNVSGFTKLKTLECYYNQIKGDKMLALVNSLPTVEKGDFYAIAKPLNSGDTEQNTITAEQAGIAKMKGWTPYKRFGADDNANIVIDACIAIDATNFPDIKFRDFLREQSYGKDGKLYDSEIDAVTTMDVSGKSIANLKGIKWFTALITLKCQNNQLTSLDVSRDGKLTNLHCYGNRIFGANMQAIVENLPLNSNGKLYAIDKKNSSEQNIITESQVFYATTYRKWKVYDYNAGSPKEYEGGVPGLEINEMYFPDANFRNWVLAQEYGKDGYLSDAEIAAVTEITVNRKNIADLKGIEHFTALTQLFCVGNKLTRLDVSANTALKTLNCSENRLGAINLSKNTALTGLYCNNNELTALDVSKNTALKTLYCWSNQIKGVKGVNMQTLVESLPTVSGSGGKFFVIDTKDSNEGNEITRPQVTIAKNKNWTVYDHNGGNGAVVYAGSGDPDGIAINSTNFPDANFRSFVSANTIDKDKDGYLTDDEIAAVTKIDVSKKSIKNLKGIEHFTALTQLFCSENELTSLDVSNNTKLQTLSCMTNKLTSLNVSGCSALSMLFCYDNKLTELNLSTNTKLTTLYCYVNQIKGDKMQALVESLPKVTDGKFWVINTKNSSEQNVITKSQVAVAKGKGWSVYDNNGGSGVVYDGVIAIDATNFPDEKFRNWVFAQEYGKDGYLTDAEIKAVTSIDVNGKNIANLKGIEHFTAVTMLQCFNNQLTELALSANTKLIYLSCANNQLKSLDLSKNTALQTLYCYHNQLTALDVSKNTALKTLSCYGNQLKGDKMQALVESLPTVSSGDFVVVNLKSGSEQNAITKAQVAVAKGKNWTVYDYNGGSKVEYEGSDTPTGLTAVESGQLTVDSWYSIDGKRLNGEPTQKGVYIVNGKKVVK